MRSYEDKLTKLGGLTVVNRLDRSPAQQWIAWCRDGSSGDQLPVSGLTEKQLLLSVLLCVRSSRCWQRFTHGSVSSNGMPSAHES
jgi:hypothetical protein